MGRVPRCDGCRRPVSARLVEGLESSIDDLRVFCRKHPEVLALVNAEVLPLKPNGGDRKSADYQGDNITLNRGTNPTYALKRLKRDRPDLFARVVAGDLSPHAAAVEAGFRRRMFSPVDSSMTPGAT